MGGEVTDVRAQLADALYRQFHGVIINKDNAARVIDALLALPNIATVVLPEPISVDEAKSRWKWVQAWKHRRDDEKTITTWGAPKDLLTDDEARELAAALLAAANAAEQAAK